MRRHAHGEGVDCQTYALDLRAKLDGSAPAARTWLGPLLSWRFQPRLGQAEPKSSGPCVGEGGRGKAAKCSLARDSSQSGGVELGLGEHFLTEGREGSRLGPITSLGHFSVPCGLQNTRRCQCRAGYVGNGVQCLEEATPPNDRCLDTPGPCHSEAICSDLHFQEKTAGVFHLQSSAGKYNLTYSEAASRCAAQGAQLASLSQLSAAQQLGFHLCLVGWLVNGSAGYATSYPSPNCGNNHVGIVNYGVRANLLERWDAYCYRLQDVECRCRDGFVGDGNFCNGKLLDVLADNANYSIFYSMLLDYANMSREGLDFFDFLSDELTYKTLFVPLNSGFGDNMTLSWKDLELHASNITFLSLNLTHGTILPSHSEGHSLFIGDGSTGNSSVPLGARVVNISSVVEWDIVTFNGIIHSIESPMTLPLEPVTAAAAVTSSQPVAVGVTAGMMVALVLILAGGAAYFHFKIKKQGFQFHYFKAEEEADDDFSPWQEGSNPPLITIPNPIFGGHNTFYEPFDDSFPEEDFSDSHRILGDE
uniref:Stabilin 1 n=1 Tax=Ornithorhynchus anatinus TaxID=9258 RepID=A0A6I8PPB8_ORNAN